jgi:hypothetical protein
MKIHDTGRLVVWFKDVPSDGRLPTTAAPLAKTEKSGPTAAQLTSMPRPLPTGPAGAAEINRTPGPTAVASADHATVQLAGPPKPAAEPRPIDLSAQSVEAWVLRSESRNTLDRVWCQGRMVQVKQAPANPDEKGVDIVGETLLMQSRPEGNFLTVTGDLAQLRMDKIYIIGLEVNIDQAVNKAWVTGPGAMQMESKTNFQGEPLARPVPMDVNWHKSMLFDGNYAEFHENVQAVQENSHMLCQRLEVHFDRAISLKEGAKGDQPPARVQTLVCDHSVDIFEETKEGAKLVKYQNLTCPWVTMIALEPDDTPPLPAQPQSTGAASNNGNKVQASGRGTLRIWQAGGLESAERPAKPPAKPTDKPAEQMKLTYVSFDKSMYANSKKNISTRTCAS